MKLVRRVLPLLLVAGFVVVLAVPARAAITATVSGGSLSVAGTDNDDTITLTCDTTVRVNGKNAVPATACADLTSIDVAARDGGDSVELQAVTMAEFPSLGPITVLGGRGRDHITGSPLDDELRSGDGLDVIDGWAGNDVMAGGADVDQLDVTFSGSMAVTQTQLVADGDVSELSGFERGLLFGSSGDDLIDGDETTMDLYIDTLAGNDTAVSGDGNDILLGGIGHDTLHGGRLSDRIYADEGIDAYRGGPGNDEIHSLTPVSGTVTLTDIGVTIGGVLDSLHGFEFASLTGFDSGVTIDASGFSGTTVLTGGEGNDTLLGGSGDDNLRPMSGTDVVDGGTGGNDLVSLSAIGDALLTSTDFGSTGIDVSLSAIDRAEIDTDDGTGIRIDARAFDGPLFILGGAGDDVILGGPLTDFLVGANGADTIKGFDGNDDLLGEGGPDTLVGGAGQDTCDGGGGSDTLSNTCEKKVP